MHSEVHATNAFNIKPSLRPDAPKKAYLNQIYSHILPHLKIVLKIKVRKNFGSNFELQLLSACAITNL